MPGINWYLSGAPLQFSLNPAVLMSQLASNPAKAASPSTPAPAPTSAPTSASDLFSGIVAQGEAVRQLKVAKAPKEEVDKAVQLLLSLKVHQL